MTSPSEPKKYVVGIEYDTPDGNMGFFDIRRRVTLRALAKEVAGYIQNGKSSFPAFPPEANPAILYAWDLGLWEDGDVYSSLIEEICLLPMKKVA